MTKTYFGKKKQKNTLYEPQAGNTVQIPLHEYVPQLEKMASLIRTNDVRTKKKSDNRFVPYEPRVVEPQQINSCNTGICACIKDILNRHGATFR